MARKSAPRTLLDPAQALREFLAAPPSDAARAEARERVIVAHLPLVRQVVARLDVPHAERKELVQVGTIGLIAAVDRFDPTRRTPFGAFATPWIEGEIRHFQRDLAPVVRLPRGVSDHRPAVIRSAAQLAHELGRLPRVDEVAGRAQVSERLVRAVLDTSPLVAPIPLEELLEAGAAPAWEACDDVDLIELRETLRALLATIDCRSRRVLVSYFVDESPQHDIARELGVAQMTVSRIIERALRRLRAAADAPGVRSAALSGRRTVPSAATPPRPARLR